MMIDRSRHLLGIAGIIHGGVWLAAGGNVKARVELFYGSTEGTALNSCCDRIKRVVVYFTPAA